MENQRQDIPTQANHNQQQQQQFQSPQHSRKQYMISGMNSLNNSPRNSVNQQKLEEYQLLFIQQQFQRIKEKSEYRKAYPQLVKIIYAPAYRFESLSQKLKLQVLENTVYCIQRICQKYFRDPSFDKRTHSHKKIYDILQIGEDVLSQWNDQLELEYLDQVQNLSKNNRRQSAMRSRSKSNSYIHQQDGGDGTPRSRNQSSISMSSDIQYPDIDSLEPEQMLYDFQGDVLTNKTCINFVTSQLKLFYCYLQLFKRGFNQFKMDQYKYILYRALDYIKIFKDQIIKEYELQNIIIQINLEHANFIFESQNFKEAKLLYDIVIDKMAHILTGSMASFDTVKKDDLEKKKKKYLEMSKSIHQLIAVLVIYSELQIYLKNFNKCHETLKLILFLQEKFKYELEDSDDLTGRVYEMLEEFEDKNNPYSLMQKSDAEIRKILGRVFGDELIQKKIQYQEKKQNDQDQYDKKMYKRYGYQALNDNLFIFLRDKNNSKNQSKNLHNQLDPNQSGLNSIKNRSKSKRFQRQSILLIESMQNNLQQHLQLQSPKNNTNYFTNESNRKIDNSNSQRTFINKKASQQSLQTPKNSNAQDILNQTQKSAFDQQTNKNKSINTNNTTGLNSTQMNSVQESTQLTIPQQNSQHQSQQQQQNDQSQSQQFLIQSEYIPEQTIHQSTQRSPKIKIEIDKSGSKQHFNSNYSTQASQINYNLNSKDTLITTSNQYQQQNQNMFLNNTSNSIFNNNNSNHNLNNTVNSGGLNMAHSISYKNNGLQNRFITDRHNSDRNIRLLKKKKEKPIIYTINDSQLKKIYYKDSSICLKDAKVLTTDQYWLPPNQRTCYSQPFENMTMLMKNPPKKQSQFFNEEQHNLKKKKNDSLDLDQHFKEIIEYKFNKSNAKQGQGSQTLPFFHVKQGLECIQQDEIFDNKEFTNGIKMIKFRQLYCQGERTIDSKKKTYLNQKLTEEEKMILEPKISKVNTLNEMQGETQFFESQFVCQEFIDQRKLMIQQQKKSQMNLLEGAASPTKTSTKNLHNRVNVSLKSKLLTHSTQLGLGTIKKQHKQQKQLEHYKDLKIGTPHNNPQSNTTLQPPKSVRDKKKTLDPMSLDEFNSITKNTITQYVHSAEDRDVQIDKETEELKKKTHFEEGYQMKTMPKKCLTVANSNKQFEYFRNTENNINPNELSTYITANKYHLREQGKRAQNFADIASNLMKKNKLQQHVNQKVQFSNTSVKTSKSIRLMNRLDSRLNC